MNNMNNILIRKWKTIYFSECETMITLMELSEANELSADEKQYLLEWAGDDEYAYVNCDGVLVYKESM